MKKFFFAILWLLSAFSFAETWTRTLQGYDCQKSCWFYSDSSNVLYGKNFSTSTSDEIWFFELSSVFFYDLQMTFGRPNCDVTFGRLNCDSTQNRNPGHIAFSYNPTLTGCSIPEAFSYEHQCEYGLSVVFDDTSETMRDSLWLQKTPGFTFEETLDLSDTNQFYFVKPILTPIDSGLFLTDLVEERYSSRTHGVYKNSLTGNSIYYSIFAALDSIYFVYRKDSSYFAYCRLLQARACDSFLAECVFQTDMQPHFPAFEVKEYPYPNYTLLWSMTEGGNQNISTCQTLETIGDFFETTTALPARRQILPGKVEGKFYQLNGSANFGNHTGAVIQNGKVKVLMKK